MNYGEADKIIDERIERIYEQKCALKKQSIKFNKIFNEFKKELPEENIYTNTTMKPEDFAVKYYEKKGFKVYKSKVDDGYRGQWGWPLSRKQQIINKNIHGALKIGKEYSTFMGAISIKNGCADLILIKDGKIYFKEVKANNEAIKPATLEFYIRLKGKFPLSIFRVRKGQDKLGETYQNHFGGVMLNEKLKRIEIYDERTDPNWHDRADKKMLFMCRRKLTFRVNNEGYKHGLYGSPEFSEEEFLKDGVFK